MLHGVVIGLALNCT